MTNQCDKLLHGLDVECKACVGEESVCSSHDKTSDLNLLIYFAFKLCTLGNCKFKYSLYKSKK